MVVTASLVGCGSVVKVDNQGGYKRSAKSVRVEFQTQNRVPLKVTRYSRVPIGAIDPRDMQKSHQEVAEFAQVVRAHTVAGVEAAMKERNIPAGDDATIFIEVSEATHQGYIGLKLGVWTHFKDAPPQAKRWVFSVDVSNDTREQLSVAAAKAADAVVRTLVNEGVLVGPGR
jgi:hypothetical protein